MKWLIIKVEKKDNLRESTILYLDSGLVNVSLIHLAKVIRSEIVEWEFRNDIVVNNVRLSNYKVSYGGVKKK